MYAGLKKMAVFLCVFTLYFMPFSSHLVYAQDSTSVEKVNERNPSLDIQRAIISQNNRTEAKVDKLESLISTQNEEIRKLEIQIKSIVDRPSNTGMTFETWTGILLACISVLVTILGVGVALLSLVGYRDLIEKGTEKAALVAAKQTEERFDTFIKQGRLDGVIAEVMNKIAFRGIDSGDQNYVDPEDMELDK